MRIKKGNLQKVTFSIVGFGGRANAYLTALEENY